ncbi:MAG: integrase arm-type DNA-binding domain-containing protein [Acidihalobacter sp.]|uniref:tyrosine-type recombinase/integrase n=1 Tax=Acidihalobacter sp. TaxID=1872108 RepID=UPI00307F5F84
MPLSDTQIRNAKPGLTPQGKETTKPYKMGDSGGLYLEVAPSGGKWWRFKYRFEGKQKRLSLGVYPDITLKAARARRDEARTLLAEGVDPGEHRKAVKAAKTDRAANSYEVIAREWHDKHSATLNPEHAERILRRQERDIFPWIGGRPVSEVTPPELLQALRRIEARGAIQTAHRALGDCGQIFRYAVATGRTQRDPTPDLRGALSSYRAEHFAAVTDPDRLAELLRIMDGYEGTLTVRCALRVAPLVFVRPGELRQAQWADIDLDAAEWRYIVTKTNTQHIVPLSTQAVAILRELEPLTGRGQYVFPSARNPRGDRPMSENTVNAAMRRLGIPKDEMSGHGFRAAARTILDEVLGFRPDFIEHQLAHAVRDPNGRAYNRTAHLPERRKMMQAWADYLDQIKAGSNVVALRAGA